MENKSPVLGILSIIFSAVSFIVMWWLSMVGVICGCISLAKDENKVPGIIGLVLGIIALIIVLL